MCCCREADVGSYRFSCVLQGRCRLRRTTWRGRWGVSSLCADSGGSGRIRAVPGAILYPAAALSSGGVGIVRAFLLVLPQSRGAEGL